MIVRGDFKWKENIVGSEVVFVINENGKYLMETNEN